MKKELLAFLFTSSALLADPCNDYYVHWFGIGHREGRGIGFDQGYTTLSTFLVAQKDFFSFCPFVDLRVHVFNQGRPAGNFGIGGRTFLNEWDAIAGVNLFYDFRKTEHRMAHQFGFGFEWLGKSWDFFANGYVPVGPLRSHFFDTRIVEDKTLRFSGFEGNHLMIGEMRKDIFTQRQFEFGGFDAFAKKIFYDTGKAFLSAEVGPYFYFGEYRKNIYGGSFRLNANIMEYVVVSGEVNYDSLFRTTANLFVGVQIPFECRTFNKRNPCNTCDILQSKLARRVDRREIIPVKIEDRHITRVTPQQVALNHEGDPYEFIFVDNTNGRSGDGTFEDPYNTLVSVPGDIIYVFEGDGTTSGMDGGIVLQDFQQLYGSGHPFILDAQQGPILVPPMTLGSPQITNLSGNAITLGNYNLVNGMTIVDPSLNGIYGFEIQTATLTHNDISFTGHGSAILLEDCSGSFQISGNTLSSTVSSPVFTDAGIYYNDLEASQVNLVVGENTVDGFFTGIRLYGTGTEMGAFVENNAVSNGIDVSLYDSSFAEVLLWGNEASGIELLSASGSFVESDVEYNSVTSFTAMTDSEGTLFLNLDGEYIGEITGEFVVP